MKINKPVMKSDVSGGVDAFGRASFARQLAHALDRRPGAEGIVIGLEGKWGSGKSFVISQVLSVLDEASPKPIVVQFNPWLVSGAASLVEAMLEQIAAALGRDQPAHLGVRGLRAGGKIIGYVKALRGLRGFESAAPGPESAAIIQAAATVGDVAAVIDELNLRKPEDKEKLKVLLNSRDLQALKADVTESILALKKSVVVVLDDADRLDQDEIRHLVRAIKAVANFRSVTYLLAYDRQVFASALSNASGAAGGAQYLEKIIQVSYPLPALLPWRFRVFVEKKINEVFAENKIYIAEMERQRWSQCVSYSSRLCRHPRDIERLCNRLRLVLPAMKNELLVSDIVLFQALSIAYPDVTDFIIDNLEEFVGVIPNENEEFGERHYWRQATTKEEKPTGIVQLEALIKDKDKNPYLISAVDHLFPKRDHGEQLDGLPLGIKSWDRFLRLLAFSRADGVPEVEEIRSTLSDPTLLESALTESPGDSVNFAVWAEKFMSDIQLDKPLDVIRVICKSASSLGRRADSNRHEVFNYLGDLIIKILRTQEVSNKNACQEIVKSSLLSLSHRLVVSINEERKYPSKHSLLSLGDSTAIINQWLRKVRSFADSGEIVSEPFLHSVLWRWAQLGGDFDLVRKAIRTICGDPVGLRKFACHPNYVGDFPLNIQELDLVWDRQEFTDLVRHDRQLAIDCSSLIERLESEEAREYFSNRS